MSERLSRYVQKAVPFVISGIFAIGASSEANASSNPVNLSTPDKRIVQVDNPQDPAGQEVALALMNNGQEVYPKNVPFTDESVISELRQIYSLSDEATFSNVVWDGISGTKTVLQVTDSILSYIVIDPDNNVKYSQYSDLETAKLMAITPPERPYIFINGKEVRKPTMGVTEIPKPADYMPGYAVGGLVVKTEEVDSTIMSVLDPNKEINVRMQRVYFVIRDDKKGKIYKLRLNNLVYGKSAYTYSTDNKSNAKIIPWGELVPQLNSNALTYVFPIRQQTSDDLIKAFGKCDDLCEKVASFYDIYTGKTQEVMQGILDGTFDPSTSDFVDIGPAMHYVFAPRK